MPPSAHLSGRAYKDELDRPLFETALAEMPDWLVGLASNTRATEPSSNGHRSTFDNWVQRLTGAPEGHRRALALEIAGHYLGLLGPGCVGQVEAILVSYAARCTPPFPEAEVRDLVRDLARRDTVKNQNADGGGVDGPTLALVTVGELLREPDDAHSWIVEGRLPSAGFGLFAGKPKAGKSTAVRGLALAVARGRPWLGFPTTQGPVIYLALEEKRAEVREHFRRLGATADDPIHLLCESAPRDAQDRLRRDANRLRPALIIIDPLFRFVRVDNANDYATMTAALEPPLVLARETGAHVVCVHHLGKGERADGDNVLGSTAIFGAVDTTFLMKRTDRFRTLSSIQRYGDDLEEITVTLDSKTRELVPGPPRREVEKFEAERLILAHLTTVKAPVTEADLDGPIECRRQAWKSALRALHRDERITRSGRGGKGDPFRYALPDRAEIPSEETG